MYIDRRAWCAHCGDQMRRLYIRCNGGHYFCGKSCPYDAWTMDGVSALVDCFNDKLRRGEMPDMSSLRTAILSDELLRRLSIIEFGAEEAMFDALVPERYVYKGQDLLWRDTGPELS